MNYTLTTDSQTGCISLAGTLGVRTAAEIRTRLLHMLNQVDELQIDLSGVKELDTEGLQMLLFFKLIEGKNVRFCHHSAMVQKLLRMTNLQDKLDVTS